MPPATKKHRPPLLVVSNDKAKSDLILRIVSPITPLMMTGEMRNTLRLSEMVRLQQNNLIASGHYEKKDSASVKSSASEERDNDADEEDVEDDSAEIGNPDSIREAEAGEAEAGATKDAVPNEGAEEAAKEAVANPEAEKEQRDSLGESPVGEEFERMTGAMLRKKLKRDNAPGPLHFSPGARPTAPAINSAPMRSYYSGYPQKRMPVRYVYHPVPYSAMLVQTPLRRSMPMLAIPAPRKGPVRRRKPVLDVFHGDISRTAPMSSQPPSAHVERFDDLDEDHLVATEEEMKEMEQKREASSNLMHGTITFNDLAAFNFKIYKGKLPDAKEKFMKICETTWDEYNKS